MKHLIFGLLLPSLLLASAPASAQQSPTPSNFTYNMKMGNGPQTINFSVAVTVKSTERNGTRNVGIALSMPHMPMDGKKVDGTIAPSGEITIASTGQFNTNPGFSISAAKANEAAATGPMIQNFIAPLNDFAAGCAKAPSKKVGATWHAFQQLTQTDVIYTITGREQSGGHDTLAISMKSVPGAQATIVGQGNYDATAHLATNVHSETEQSMANGMKQIFDATLTGM